MLRIIKAFKSYLVNLLQEEEPTADELAEIEAERRVWEWFRANGL